MQRMYEATFALDLEAEVAIHNRWRNGLLFDFFNLPIKIPEGSWKKCCNQHNGEAQ